MVLEVLEGHGVQATFFILGWVVEARPQLVSMIVAAGHEFAVHGYAHVLESSLTDTELEEDTRRAFDVVGSAAGIAPVGYRSPGGSLFVRQRWLLDLLMELGIRFDSSIYPRPGGLAEAEGYPTQPYVIHRQGENVLWEFPSTIRPWLGIQWAFAEGGYLRLLPLPLVRRWFREYEQAGKSVNLCIHPREFDPAQPRLPLALFKQWKAQVGLAGFDSKVESLFGEYRFDRIGSVLGLY